MISSRVPIFLLFLTFSMMVGSHALNSQSLAGFDLRTVKIDELSDEQVQAFTDKAEERGLSLIQLESLARDKGMPEVEISKLKRRIAQINTGTPESGIQPAGVRVEPSVDGSAFGSVSSNQSMAIPNGLQSKVFGYRLFSSNNLTFAPSLNIPTPKGYILGPKDELIVNLWGATQLNLSLVISPEGIVQPDNLGPIYLNGLTIEQAEKKLIGQLSQIYSGLKSSPEADPTVFSQVSLGAIKTINVTVVGEVNAPGNYILNSLSRVYTALHASGGPTKDGTFRAIRLIRNNKLFAEIDLYDFLVDGIRSGDELLRDGDVILVKPYMNRVEIGGEVKTPALYELHDKQSLSDLLGYAGGFTSLADKTIISAKRNGSGQKELIDISMNDIDNFQPIDGDAFVITPILNKYSNRVQIEGAVFRPGDYQLVEGLTIKALIEQAKGLRGDAYMVRATIYRLGDDLTQSTISVDLAGLMNGSIQDLILKSEDIVRINSIHDMREEYYVRISGEVQVAGAYPFFNQMTVPELIVLAGGLTEGASGALIEISRRTTNAVANEISEIIHLKIDKNLSLVNESKDVFIQPFDKVYIRRVSGYFEQQEVIIEGEAFVPGNYAINKKDERISDLVKRAGGLTLSAYPEGAILVRNTEFTPEQSKGRVPAEILNSIGEKLLSGQSEMKDVTKNILSERLSILIEEARMDHSDDIVGSAVKRTLINENVARDSLATGLTRDRKEAVALNLLKILENPGSKYDLIVRSGDVISIPVKSQTVRVTGEVTSPLNLRYDKSYNLRDYITQSGGFLASAKRNRTYVQYANGERRGVKRFLFFKKFPKVEPGATIFITRKPERRPLDVQSVIGAVGSVLTLFLLVDRLTAN